MSRATPQLRAFAEHLISHATSRKPSSRTEAFAAFYVCERLRPHLATLMGGTGFQALLSRALAVASVDDAWLRTVQVKADGSLEGPKKSTAKTAPADMAEGSVVLVAQLLGLLVAFIGEPLTLRIVGEVWPKFSLNDLASNKGDKK